MTVKEEYRRADLDFYTETEANAVAISISLGILVNKALYLWAWQLQQYSRRYSPALVFGASGFVYLFVAAALCLALVNLTILKLTPDQFQLDLPVTLIGIVGYSISSFAFAQVGGIHAIGDLAIAVNVLSGVLGVVGLLSLVLNVVMTVRREADERATNQLILDLRARARALESEFLVEYDVGIDEARRRLEQIGGGLTFLLRFLASIPDEFVKSDIGAEDPPSTGPLRV